MAIDIGKISEEYLDFIIIKEDIDKRGREAGEIADLIKSGIKNKEKCKVLLEECKAFEEAIKVSSKGDIIIVFFEELEPLINVIENYKNHNTDERIASL